MTSEFRADAALREHFEPADLASTRTRRPSVPGSGLQGLESRQAGFATRRMAGHGSIWGRHIRPGIHRDYHWPAAGQDLSNAVPDHALPAPAVKIYFPLPAVEGIKLSMLYC